MGAEIVVRRIKKQKCDILVQHFANHKPPNHQTTKEALRPNQQSDGRKQRSSNSSKTWTKSQEVGLAHLEDDFTPLSK